MSKNPRRKRTSRPITIPAAIAKVIADHVANPDPTGWVRKVGEEFQRLTGRELTDEDLVRFFAYNSNITREAYERTTDREIVSLIEDWCRYEAHKHRTSDSVSEVAADSGPTPGVAEAPGLADAVQVGDWEFATGKASYKGHWINLAGQPAKLLQEFVSRRWPYRHICFAKRIVLVKPQ
jgi:hypothetical protein